VPGPEPTWPDPTRPERSRLKALWTGGRTLWVLAGSAVVLGGAGSGIVAALSGDGTHGASPPPLELGRVRAAVESAPPSAFRSLIVRARLLNEIDRAAVAAADGSFVAAGARLQLLRPHLDGCTSAAGTPDANDWVVGCADQVRIRRGLDDALDSLSR
jgi:hypothetical protein